MPYDGREVANFILDMCERKDRPISNLSMQKIAFFCHAWSLIELRKPLVKQHFEAWEFGPVLQYLYREFKKYHNGNITGRATKIDPVTGRRQVAAYNFELQTSALLENVIDFYSKLNSFELVKLTHVEDGPWHSVWHHSGTTNPGMIIRNEEIQAFYSIVRPPFCLQ